MSAVFNPKDGLYYDAMTAEDAHYVRLGRPDLVPGIRVVPEPVKHQDGPRKDVHGTLDPSTGERWHANSAEDAYFISLGRRDLAPGSRRA